MYRPRVIPVILIDSDDQAIKTVNFKKRSYIGDPVNTVSLFNSFLVDELVLLNIDSSKKKSRINYDLLKEISQEAKMPFAVGGGIKSLEDIRKILSIGAEKVILSEVFLDSPSFLKRAVKKFGSSSIVVCIDVKKDFFGKQNVIFRKKKYHKSLHATLDLVEHFEAGELIIQSINNDGTMNGYDNSLLKEVTDYLSIPTIALGGCKSLDEIYNHSSHNNVSGYAAGSLFVYQNKDKGVLINYPTQDELAALYKT